VNRPVPELPLTDEGQALISLKSGAPRGANGNGNGNGNGHHGHGETGGHRVVLTLSDAVAHFQQDAPTCPNCGHVAVRNGACYKCLNCGESLGCS